MRTLVALAVMGLCSALPHQAYTSFPSYSYGGTYQPKYTGPLASSVPAGVDGKVIPVSDTYEVAAAKNAFFDAYQRQLAAVGAYGRYGATPAYHHAPVHTVVHAPTHHVVHAPTHHVVHTPAHHVVHAPSYHPAASYSVPSTVVVANGHVQDTPEVAAAKSQFFHLYNKQAAAAAAAPDDYVHHDDYHHGHHY
ncbi:cuticle protein CP1499-like isoform X2 [Palaemon carinicauda]|uniref:cuticle protein CP1499-like isoform X1 n=1 Tax=Palaemon carinicauda TaxID=392227 RepID=UPI0035B57470